MSLSDRGLTCLAGDVLYILVGQEGESACVHNGVETREGLCSQMVNITFSFSSSWGSLQGTEQHHDRSRRWVEARQSPGKFVISIEAALLYKPYSASLFITNVREPLLVLEKNWLLIFHLTLIETKIPKIQEIPHWRQFT